MKVKIHTLFQYLLDTTQAEPDAFVGFSLSDPPKLADFLNDIDPQMSLDWNQKSFRGLPALRQHVIDRAVLNGRCDADDVLITAGAAEANYLAFMQVVQEGDEVVTERPGWPQIEVLANAIKAKVRLIERDEQAGWTLSLEQLEQCVTDKTRMIFLTNPNNPTGKLLTKPELLRLVEIAERVGAWLVVDEVYAGLEWSSGRVESVAGLYDRGITTGSVSKALGLQGIRTGWIICRNAEFLMDAIVLRENSSEIMNVMGETIAEIALRPDRYARSLSRARRDGKATLRKLNNYIEAQPELSWHPPEAGLIGLARLQDGIDGDAFARRLLADPYNTFLLPGSCYGLAKHIRVGVGGGAAANLDLGLSRMSQLLAGWT